MELEKINEQHTVVANMYCDYINEVCSDVVGGSRAVSTMMGRSENWLILKKLKYKEIGTLKKMATMIQHLKKT